METAFVTKMCYHISFFSSKQHKNIQIFAKLFYFFSVFSVISFETWKATVAFGKD